MKILSAMQSTGGLHIGNYLGALTQWVELQKQGECIFIIVDLHAITVDYNPKKMPEKILNVAMDYLSAGVDPEKSILFIQSHVKEHAELAWLLNTITPISELQRMTQFKDKSKEHKENINMGLFDYPVLMAADILLYKTDIVPVGRDQSQHVELARIIAKKFNNKFGQTFVLPNVQLRKFGARIMSLSDPLKKMSKTHGLNSYIGLTDSSEEIKNKIKKAKTDSGSEIKYDEKNKPAISNLLTIYHLFSGKEINKIEKKI